MSASALDILLVDDSKAVHAFLDRAFVGTSHRLTHVMDGVECLMSLATSHFDIVLLDYEMPNLMGSQVLDQMKEKAIRVPVVMMTSKNDPKLISEMLGKGAKEYIMKPFTPDIVFEKIGFALGLDVKVG